MPDLHDASPFLLGIAAIDHAHADLLDLLVRMRHLTEGEFPAACATLAACLQRDFAEEEQLMEAAGYYALAVHRAEHRQVLDRLRLATAAFEAGDPAPLRGTVLELSDWLEAHIVTMDMALAVALTGSANGVAPAQPSDCSCA